MIARLAVRLAVSRDRMSRWRQLSVVVAATAGAVALLFVVSFHEAASRVEHRLDARSIVVAHDGAAPQLHYLLGYDTLGGHQFEVRYVEPLRAGAPTPPGVREWPRPGGYVVSPELQRRIAADPSLQARYRDVAVIGDPGLSDRDELLAYRRPPAGSSIDLERGGVEVAGWGGLGESGDARTDLGSLLMPCAVLVDLPALFLLWGATRTAAVQRDRRLLLLHWLGVPRRTAAALAAVETAALVLPGALAGSLLWWWWGRSVAWLPVVAFRPIPGDLAASAPEAVVIGLGVVLGAAVHAFARGLRVPSTEEGTRPWAQPRLSRLALVPSVAGAGLVVWQLVQPPRTVSFGLLITTPLLLATGAALMAPFVVRGVAAWLATARESVVSLLAGRGVERDPAGFARPMVGLGVFAFLALVAVHLVYVESRYEEEASPQDDRLQAAIVSIVADDATEAAAFAQAQLPDELVAAIDRETFAIATTCERVERVFAAPSCDADGSLTPAADERLHRVLALAPGSPVELVPTLEHASALLPGLVAIGSTDVDLHTVLANAVMPRFLTVQVLTFEDFTLRASGIWGWVEGGLVAGGLLTTLGLFVTAVDRSIRDPMLAALGRLGAAVRVRRRIYVARFVVAYAVVMAVLLAAGTLNGILILRASREHGMPLDAIGAIYLGAAVLPLLGALGLLASRDWSREDH